MRLRSTMYVAFASLRKVVAVGLGSLVVAGELAAAEPRPVTDSMAERVVPCTSCHGREGRATPEGYFPRIAGKPAGYLHNQLLNFRDGRRNYPLMVYLVEHLTDAYLREMAQHFATLELPYPAPQPSNLPPRLTSVAEGLVRRGDPGREIPACAQCHGEQLLGVAPDMPGLLGLSRYYLYAQLNQWKNGTRRAQVPDCMATIASRLTPEEVSALAAWLAAQPVGASGKPADGFAGPLPMRCGSIADKGAG